MWNLRLCYGLLQEGPIRMGSPTILMVTVVVIRRGVNLAVRLMGHDVSRFMGRSEFGHHGHAMGLRGKG